MLECVEKTDSEPKWTFLYDAVKDFDYGEFLPFEKLTALTGFNMKSIRGLIHKTNQHMLKNDSKMLVNVRKKGYKIAAPQEQIAHAANRKTRGTRQLKRGVNELINLETSKMSKDEVVQSVHLLNHIQTSLRVVRSKNVDALVHSKKATAAAKDSIGTLDKIFMEIKSIKDRMKAG